MHFFVVNWMYVQKEELPDYLFADNPGVFSLVSMFLMNFHWMSRNLVEIDSFDEVMRAGLVYEKILSANLTFIPKLHQKYHIFYESYAYIIFSIAYGDFFM